MHVLMTEASFNESTQVAEALRGARQYVSTCHEGSGVCQALRPGRYPLDHERPVDLVVDLRGQQPELTAPIYLTAEGHDRTGGAAMHAKPGDWLVVETSTLDRHEVRGRIEEVLSTTGEPPYRVRWTQDDHVSIVFPGPDARVLTSAELTKLDAGRSRHFTGRSGSTSR